MQSNTNHVKPMPTISRLRETYEQNCEKYGPEKMAGTFKAGTLLSKFI